MGPDNAWLRNRAAGAPHCDEAHRLMDEALANRVLAMLSESRWQQCCAIGVTVRDAVVMLDGTCSDDFCLETIEQAVREVDSLLGTA
jgi:osmotically-inducible protein OsmY